MISVSRKLPADGALDFLQEYCYSLDFYGRCGNNVATTGTFVFEKAPRIFAIFYNAGDQSVLLGHVHRSLAETVRNTSSVEQEWSIGIS